MPKNFFHYIIVLLFILCFHATAKDFTLVSFRAPEAYLSKVRGEKYKFSKPRVYAELTVGGNIVWRSKPLPFVKNRDAYYFNQEIKTNDDWNNSCIVILFWIGENGKIERSCEVAKGTAIGAAGGAGIGAIIGGCVCGFFTLGFGAPAGAAIGAAIGGTVGGTAGAAVGGFLVNVEGARELASFEFKSVDGIPGKHVITIDKGDILLDGKVIEFEIR